MTDKLSRITGQPCILKSGTGGTIGFARCNIQLSNQHTQIQGPGMINQIMPNISPTVYVFDILNGNRGILDQTQSMVTVLCTGDNEYFKFDFPLLVQISAGSVYFSFRPDSVVETPISVQEFNELCTTQMPIEWANIKLQPGGNTCDYAFEELCRELLLRNQCYSNFSFLPPGPDRGRDGTYDLIENPFPRTSSKAKCILQCKYSHSITQNITMGEINNELVKVQQHAPTYYILATNRNTTQDFVDWFNTIPNISFGRILVQRQTIENIVRSYIDLWGKYFG